MAGVSVATVSYVLNGTAPISDKTREKVERIIRETGYRSNMLAKSLRTNESRLIGILVEDITVWHTPQIIDGINEIAERQGYHTILSNLRLMSKIASRFEDISNYQEDIDREVDMLAGMQVDGIIYVGMHDRMLPEMISDIGKPVVYCYCYPMGRGSSVRYDNEEVLYQLTGLMLKKGYRRFGVIGGLEGSEPAALRLKGFQRAMKEAGIEVPPENVLCGGWNYKEGRETAGKLLDRKDFPQIIMAMNDEMAVGVYDAATELGLKIPEDVAVTGFDHAAIAQHISPELVTVERPLQAMGYHAMELLTEQISGREEENQDIILPCRIIPGASVRADGYR
ncbi:MAG: LacI family DNA-binding transcriptional regulator [Lachnospiraceae bacterium]|nr:LacI family DNA-binding transcriptional regulator [Lachnospiraceae bacterium]